MTMAWCVARKTVRHHLGEKVSRVVCEQDFPEARRVQRQPAPPLETTPNHQFGHREVCGGLQKRGALTKLLQ